MKKSNSLTQNQKPSIRMMTEGAPWKHILLFAMPVLAGSLLQQLYNTIDAIIVGRFAGEASLSAVGTTGSMVFLFLAIAMGFSAGNGVVISQHYGAGKQEKVRQAASTGLILLFGMGILAMIAALLSSRLIFTHGVKVPDGFLDQTLLYFRIYALGLVFQFGYNAIAAILRAIGDSASTMYFLFIASCVNIVLDILFVAGFHWGVTGAAAATDVSQLLSLIAAYLYMRKKYPMFRFRPKEYRLNRELAIATLKIGYPIALQMMVVSLGLTFIQRAVNEFGQSMTASYTVGSRMEMYLNLPCSAFSTTLATYTGQNIGAGKMDRVRKGLRQTMIISLAMTLIISGLVWFFAGNIASLFGVSYQAAEYCQAHLKTVAFVNIILSMYIPVFGVFQGANHSAVPTVVAGSALTVRVVTTYLFRYSSFLGYRIIWWNGVFGFGMGFVIAWAYYFSKRWMNNASIS